VPRDAQDDQWLLGAGAATPDLRVCHDLRMKQVERPQTCWGHLRHRRPGTVRRHQLHAGAQDPGGEQFSDADTVIGLRPLWAHIGGLGSSAVAGSYPTKRRTRTIGSRNDSRMRRS